MKRAARLAARLLLLPLAAVFALPAHAALTKESSRASVWESNPPASFDLTKAEAASALAPLAPAATADADLPESPLFNLGDIILADTADGDAEHFDLGPLTLVDLNLLRGPPPSYPETRVGGFELLPPFRVGASAPLSLWSRQACGFVCREVVSDSRYDPWGLQSAEGEEPVDQDWADAAGVWADTRARQERGLNAGKRAAGYIGKGLDVATDFAPGIGLAKIPQFFIEAYQRGGRDELKKMGLSVAVVTAIAVAITHRSRLPGVKVTEEEAALASKSEAFLSLEERRLAKEAAEAGFPGWKAGERITKATAEGAYPAWATVRQRYWMNRVATAPGEFGPANRAIMSHGFAPKVRAIVRMRKTGQLKEIVVEKELHHARGNRGLSGFDEPRDLREVWPWEHEKLLPGGRRLDYDFVDFAPRS